MVVAQIATPCPTRFRANPMIRNATWLKVSPSGPLMSAAAASRTVIQAGLLSTLVSRGVISAAQA
jgi:hypothetical protein